MKQGNRNKTGSTVRSLSIFVVMCLIFGLLLPMLAVIPVRAESARAAIVAEVNGEVNVKRAGGSKSYTAYEDMSLNQGDLISTGGSSSVVLRIADRDDEMTIGENAELYISDLADQGSGKVSKFKLWAGSAWSKVKSLVSSDDEFEVETPTAVMGVRGTLLFTSVDRNTGQTTLAVGSGIVSVTTITPSAPGGTAPSQTTQTVNVYPAQQLTTDSRTSTGDLRTNVGIVDINNIVSQASPKVIEAMIRNTLEIQQENELIKQKLLEELNKGIQKPDEQSVLKIISLDEFDKVARNFDSFIPNLAKQAIEQGKVKQGIIDEANKKIEDASKKIDLNHVTPLDSQAGLDPEQLKNLSQTLLQYMKEQELIQLNQERLRELLSVIEQERKKAAEANARILNEQQAAAYKAYLDTLTLEERSRVEAASKNNSGSETPASPVGSGGGGHKSSGNSGGGTTDPIVTPAVPTLVSPTGEVTTSAPEVVVKAPANTVVKIMNMGTVIAQANGNGEQEVRIPLTSLITDNITVYDQLTAVTELNGVQSLPVSIPKITVDTAPGIFVSSVTMQGQAVTAELRMKNFTGTKAFYAVEVHLLYDNGLSYSGDGNVTRDEASIFGALPQSAEMLKQTRGASSSELVYAAMGQQPVTADGSNLEVQGEQKLISVPLTLTGSDAGVPRIKIAYYKVVDKEGNVVAMFDSSSTTPAVNKS